MNSLTKTSICEWCDKNFTIGKDTCRWYGFIFCSNDCATNWGKSDRRPTEKYSEQKWLPDTGYGGSC